MDSLISVVIPCYNVEKYAARCLESVLKQTYAHLQVIVVDDGSTDGTAEILHTFASDKRVQIITQKNAGVTAARNAGIDLAKGEFITFVDSDDWLNLNMYEALHNAIIRDNADMAVCNYNLVYDGHIKKQYSKPYCGATDIRDDVYVYFCKYCACSKPNNYIWTRLYKTAIVKKSGVRFENYKLADDTLFNFKLLPYVKRVTWIPDGMYNYFQRTNSNVYTVAKKGNLANVYADTFDALADYYEANQFDTFLQVLPIHAFTRLRSIYFYSRLAGMGDHEITGSIPTVFKGRKIAAYLTGKL